ncbi:hypothetical protein C5D34_09115 [Rathayibacter sp. AY1B1]|uniref:hypothetical protein n=1 Tax=unclassified Rathayibacter TaxID=2609250 RepID=UPI000CE889A3|nr:MULTISPECIES: hypothetical protein [unclassified Rathayibacter]PPI34661.1 hypothetical protein C5D34_09115 [Rathayibacter sp. AY1B1]
MMLDRFLASLARPLRRTNRCGACGLDCGTDVFILIALATGENRDESRLREVLDHRSGHRVDVVEVRKRLLRLSRHGLVLLERGRRTPLQRIERFSITRDGRAFLASHARALDLLAEEIHVALLSR